MAIDWPRKRLRRLFAFANAGEVIDKTFWGSGDELLYTCALRPLTCDYVGFPNTKRTSGQDLLVTRNGTPYVHLPQINSIYSNVVQRVRLKAGLDRRFIAYGLQHAARRLKGYGVSIESLNFEMWKELEVHLPPLAEQTAIADFLDIETAEVHSLIAQYERLIELLEERRAARTCALITTGLDRNVPMKDSGVERIGRIPRHWTVTQLGRVLESMKNGYSGDQIAESPGITVPVTRIETISDGTIAHERVGWVLRSPTVARYLLQSGDILFSHINSLSMIGKCAIYDGVTDLYVGVNLLRLRPSPAINPRFLHAALSSTIMRQVVRSRAKPAINQSSINIGALSSIPIVLPPLDEQEAISAYLSETNLVMGEACILVRRAITILEERRAAVIADAVTGKMDVRLYTRTYRKVEETTNSAQHSH